MSRHLILATVCLLTGCEQLEPFTPKVRFDRLDINDIDFQHADVDFVFAVNNPNPVSIGLEDFTYNLELEQTPFLSGDNPEGFRLAASGASDLSLPLDLVYTELWSTVQATRGEDIVDFGLNGQMGFNTPAGVVHLPYHEIGDFPALRTPKFRFAGLRIPAVDILKGQVGIEVDLGVDNEHATTLFFDAFDYDLSLGGREVAAGLINTFAVEGDSEGIITLPVNVNLLQAGGVIFDALDGQRVDLGLNARVDVDTPFGVIPLSIDETGKLRSDPL